MENTNESMSQVWFITGAGSGIGAATARAAGMAGDRVVVERCAPHQRDGASLMSDTATQTPQLRAYESAV
jgi:NAD(P)-dependent dehydrogenase (short-subunit alcohol dehydrogenase family)